MAKKNEEIKNETVTEKPAVTPEAKEEVKEEKATAEEVKAEKAEEQKELKEENEKVENEEKLVANTDFYDKYTDEKYIKGTEFIVANVKETKKIGEKQYKISKARAEEIKAKGYIE